MNSHWRPASNNLIKLDRQNVKHKILVYRNPDQNPEQNLDRNPDRNTTSLYQFCPSIELF